MSDQYFTNAHFRRVHKSYSLVFAKNTSVSRKFGENSSKISAGGGILGKDERGYCTIIHYNKLFE